MVKDSTQIIQALPITANTFTGTATDLDVAYYNIVHAGGDGTITFDFGGGNTKAINVKDGMDLAIGEGCKTITSTMEVIVS